jgi:hypothetical protein
VHVLQAEAYCKEYRVRYFAISTYLMTWLGCIRGDRMLISRGFEWDKTGPSTLEVCIHKSYIHVLPIHGMYYTDVLPW